MAEFLFGEGTPPFLPEASTIKKQTPNNANTMGYDTFFNINITAPNKQEYDIVRKEIAGAADRNPHDIDGGFEARWYECDKDLAAISKRHPGVLIEASGDGETRDDLWTARYRDGKSETIRFEGLPHFKEILTPEEEEDVFRKASEAYDKALDALTEAAVRRIRTLKDRITGTHDSHLCLDRLNDRLPQLVIADGLPLSHREYVPVMVTGIQDDGEQVCTEGDPVDINDMLPDDMASLVRLLENLIDEIAKGTVKGRWNDDEEWYELYYTAYEEE